MAEPFSEPVSEQVSNIWSFFTDIDLWIKLGQGALKIIVIMILTTLIIKIGKTIVDKVFVNRRHGPFRVSERREVTLKKLIQNVLTYIVYFTAFIMVLDILTIEVAPLLAGAGVAGLAIGFGAQSLVKDVISGFFIIFEDQFSVGDYIATSKVEGTVEEIGLRTTKIKSWTGELNVIPNGNITQVTNYSIYNGLAVVDVNVPYESDIAEAERIIEAVAKELPDKYEEIISPPRVIGVQTLELSHYVIRIIAETPPVYQWAGARMIRKEMQEELYKAGIEIPAPRLVMYSRNEEPNQMEMKRGRNQE